MKKDLAQIRRELLWIKEVEVSNIKKQIAELPKGQRLYPLAEKLCQRFIEVMNIKYIQTWNQLKLYNATNPETARISS